TREVECVQQRVGAIAELLLGNQGAPAGNAGRKQDAGDGECDQKLEGRQPAERMPGTGGATDLLQPGMRIGNHGDAKSRNRPVASISAQRRRPLEVLAAEEGEYSASETCPPCLTAII